MRKRFLYESPDSYGVILHICSLYLPSEHSSSSSCVDEMEGSTIYHDGEVYLIGMRSYLRDGSDRDHHIIEIEYL
jgi:hypothetical protein